MDLFGGQLTKELRQAVRVLWSVGVGLVDWHEVWQVQVRAVPLSKRIDAACHCECLETEDRSGLARIEVANHVGREDMGVRERAWGSNRRKVDRRIGTGKNLDQVAKVLMVPDPVAHSGHRRLEPSGCRMVGRALAIQHGHGPPVFDQFAYYPSANPSASACNRHSSCHCSAVPFFMCCGVALLDTGVGVEPGEPRPRRLHLPRTCRSQPRHARNQVRDLHDRFGSPTDQFDLHVTP